MNNPESQKSKLLQESKEFADSNKAFVLDIYLEYLKRKNTLSSNKKDVLLKKLQRVTYNEFKYVRQIYSVDSALRMWLGWVDPSFFASYYIGLTTAEHQDKWREDFRRDRFVRLAPRGMGKSEVFSHEYPVREICYIDGMRILLISKTATLAEKYLYVVKDEFESNQKIKEDFGDLRRGMTRAEEVRDKKSLRGVEGRRWTQRMFYVVRYGDRTYKDPTMEAVGVGGAITGGRFMRIIAEDIVEVKDCKTKKSRDEIENWFGGVVTNLLEPDSRTVVIGTRKHSDDIYSRMIKNPAWFYKVDKGIIRYPEKYDYIYEEVNGKKTVVDVKMSDEGQVLWNDPTNEHSWTMKKLLLKKADLLPHIFAREIQNEITEEKDKLIPLPTIENNFDIVKTGSPLIFLKEHHTRQFLAKIVGCDFSALFDKSRKSDNENDDHSWTVYTVLGIHRETYDRQILYIWREQYKNPDEQINKLVWINDHLEPDMFVLESNVFQIIYSYLAGKMGLRNKIVSHTTGREKWSLKDGIPALARDISAGMYIIPRGDAECRLMTDQLVADLNGWGIDGETSELSDCVPPDSLIQTENGLVPIKDIREGDLVLTHKGRFRKVLKIGSRFANKVLEVKATGKIPFYLTDNHSILVFRKMYDFKSRKNTVKYCNPEWLNYNSINKGKNKYRYGSAMIPPKEAKDKSILDFAPFAKGWKEKDGFLMYGKSKGNKFPRYINIDIDFLRLVGYFLAEGTTGRHNIGFASHEDEGTIRSWVAGYVKRLGFHPCIFRIGNKKGFQLSFGSIPFNRFFKLFGKSDKKRLPQWLMILPPEKQLNIVIGWLLGDGCFKNKGKVTVVSISRELANQMYLIFLRNRFRPTLTIRKVQNGSKKGYGSNKKQYCIVLGIPDSNRLKNLIEKRFWKDKGIKIVPLVRPQDQTKSKWVNDYLVSQIKHFTEFEYNNLVHNLEVEEDNSYIVENTVVHNCTMSLWLATLKCEYYERLDRKRKETVGKSRSSVFIAG